MTYSAAALNGRQSKSNMYYASIQLEDRTMTIAATDVGLCFVSLTNNSEQELRVWAAKREPHAQLIEDSSLLADYTRQMADYFDGKRNVFTMPLHFIGTPFQQAVWGAVAQIPYGEVRTYAEIASAAGFPKAVRAVGAANGANPIPIVVPCHRVIGANGTLTGYRGGIVLKQKLLHLEGFRSFTAAGHERFRF